MKIHYLQHVPYEDLGNIEIWAKNNGHSISKTRLYKNESFPNTSNFDWLIIMGGPMNIYEDDKHPWLKREKKFIRKAIFEEKIILGICLGAQLIADALGAKVYKNKHKEIGWFKVDLTQEAKKSPVFSSLPTIFNAFHWHGDTFDLPSTAIGIAESEGCKNQAFEYKKRVIGLQFHLELTTENIKELIRNCSDEIVDGKYIQTPNKLLSENHLKEVNPKLSLLLSNIEKLTLAKD